MIVNFRARKMSREARNLAWTSTLIEKNQLMNNETCDMGLLLYDLRFGPCGC